MSYQKLKRVLSAFFIIGLIGCESNRNQAFSEAIQKARSAKLSQVNEASLGLPFFSVKTLTPIWKEDVEVVKIPSISLTDQNGKVRNEDLFKGKTTLVAFFFASCTGFCPSLIQNLKDVEKSLSEFPNMQYVVLSVDPEHDTPKVLKAYTQQFHLDSNKWTLLTGDRKTIYSLAKDTFASEAFKRASDKSFVHSEHFYVIDSKGRLRNVLNGTRKDSPQKAQEVIAQL